MCPLLPAGTLCASSYSGGEGRLYRAEVSSLPAKAFPFYTVKYIDLGDMESVKLERCGMATARVATHTHAHMHTYTRTHVQTLTNNIVHGSVILLFQLTFNTECLRLFPFG